MHIRPSNSNYGQGTFSQLKRNAGTCKNQPLSNNAEEEKMLRRHSGGEADGNRAGQHICRHNLGNRTEVIVKI